MLAVILLAECKHDNTVLCWNRLWSNFGGASRLQQVGKARSAKRASQRTRSMLPNGTKILSGTTIKKFLRKGQFDCQLLKRNFDFFSVEVIWNSCLFTLLLQCSTVNWNVQLFVYIFIEMFSCLFLILSHIQLFVYNFKSCILVSVNFETSLFTLILKWSAVYLYFIEMFSCLFIFSLICSAVCLLCYWNV